MITRSEIETSVFKFSSRTITTIIMDTETKHSDVSVYLYNRINYNFWLTFDNTTNTVVIQGLPYMRNVQILFEGVITTKAELDIVLKQIGIC